MSLRHGQVFLRRRGGKRDGRADIVGGERREGVEDLLGRRSLGKAGEDRPERPLVPLNTASPPAIRGSRWMRS